MQTTPRMDKRYMNNGQPDLTAFTRISFQIDLDDQKKTQKTTFYRYDKTAHQINKNSSSKLNKSDAQSLTIDSSSGLDTLRNEVFGTPRLPGISELMSGRNKYFSCKLYDVASNSLESRSFDHETLHKSVSSLVKYTQSLENEIRVKNKEIKRLEYLNKYLLAANEKREEMLTQMLKENQRLKELAFRAENAKYNPEKRVPKSNIPPLTVFTNPSPSYQKPSGVAHLKEAVSPRGPDRELKQVQESNVSPRTQISTNRNSNIQQTMNKLFDSRKSESILKISKN